jgi:hypothetical protein
MRHLVVICTFLALGCGPWERVAGGRLFGEIVGAPVSDWSFTDDVQTIALETRPTFPHSVTTIVFTHEGRLYVPSRNPTGKKWPYYVLADPSVRLKIGDKIYLGRATRVTEPATLRAAFASLGKKYARMASPPDPDAPLPDVWLFRIDPS